MRGYEEKDKGCGCSWLAFTSVTNALASTRKSYSGVLLPSSFVSPLIQDIIRMNLMVAIVDKNISQTVNKLCSTVGMQIIISRKSTVGFSLKCAQSQQAGGLGLRKRGKCRTLTSCFVSALQLPGRREMPQM